MTLLGVTGSSPVSLLDEARLQALLLESTFSTREVRIQAFRKSCEQGLQVCRVLPVPWRHLPALDGEQQ